MSRQNLSTMANTSDCQSFVSTSSTGQRFPESCQRSSLLHEDDWDPASDIEDDCSSIDDEENYNDDIHTVDSASYYYPDDFAEGRSGGGSRRAATPASESLNPPALDDSDSVSSASSSEGPPSPKIPSFRYQGPVINPLNFKRCPAPHVELVSELSPDSRLRTDSEQSVSFSKAVVTKFSNPPRYKLKKVKFHQCPICQKSFPRPSGLRTHMNTHTNTKPHLCPYEGCDKSFSVISNAKRHYRTHLVELPPDQGLPSGPYTVNFSEPVVVSSPPPPSPSPPLGCFINDSQLSPTPPPPKSRLSQCLYDHPGVITDRRQTTCSGVARRRKQPSALRWLPIGSDSRFLRSKLPLN